MNHISTFQIPLGEGGLRPATDDGPVPAAFSEPLRALVAEASRRAGETALTIYLCSEGDAAPARDNLAKWLAKSLTAYVPSTLLIDCSFLNPGLHGLVPQKDALGFLDFLLYGSSIGVITQDVGGVHVVGAGSFPVTKRMPFVESAFADAARRLVTHARCAIFVGPCLDDAGAVHPLSGCVSVVATVRTAPRDPHLDAAEEQIAGKGIDVWSLRLGGVTAPEPAPPVSAAPAARPAPAERVVRVQSRPTPEAETAESYSALAPRIAVIVFGLLVIAFVAWWLVQNRSSSRVDGGPGTTLSGTDSSLTPAEPDSGRAGADSTRALAVPADTAAAPGIRPRVNPADTRGRSGGTVLVNPSDIQVMEDLEHQYKGWYMIHISSFQTSIRARDEVAFLESREFPAFIVFLELGAKGKWYRVYAGPFSTREEAREVKKNLDAVPQVRFTRIATIPD